MSNETVKPLVIPDKDIFVFNSDFGPIRCTSINGIPYMIGKDVATCLGYTDTNQALRKNIPDDEKLTRLVDGTGQRRNMVFITESGLYRLAFSSKMPKAKEFTDWVVKEVLPSINKNGHYVAKSNDDLKPAVSIMNIASPKMLIHQYIDDLCEKSGCTHTSAWVLFRKVVSKYYGIDIKHEKNMHAIFNGKTVSSLYVLDQYNLLNTDTVELVRSLVYDVTDYAKLFSSMNVPSNIIDEEDMEAQVERYSVLDHKQNYQLSAIGENMPEAFDKCVGKVSREDIEKTYMYTHKQYLYPVPTPFSIAEGF